MQSTARISEAPYAAVLSLRAAWREPVEVLSAFADEVWAIGFLSGGGGADGRWSCLARRPDETLVFGASHNGDAFAALAAMLGSPALRLEDGPPFQGGVAGLAAYELGDRVEALGLGRHPDWPDLACARYPAVLAFDHERREVLGVGRGRDAAEARAAAERALGWMDAEPVAAHPGRLAGPLSASSGEAYEAAVADVVGRIERGEVFQANIARRWTGRLETGRRPFDLLARLAGASPAPFAGYLRLTDRALISNSPERFLRVSAGGMAETQPIKGTRPRGRDAAEDAAMAADLVGSAKDRAENLMIVDLMRNDLARVCAAGTVATPELWRVASFANVHHLVSTVTGRLATGRTAIDLFHAAFPPGSISGAPKVQAMKVIAGLEPPRGPFFGALFWAGFDGAFDSSVLIRSVGFRADDAGWRLEARAGAGIVADSDPHEERLETEAKIAAVAKGLNEADPLPRHGPTCSTAVRFILVDGVHGVDFTRFQPLAGDLDTREGNAMRHHNSVLHGLLKHIPWSYFDDLVEDHRADAGVRRLSTKTQLVALLYAQLSGAVSLREIETALASHSARLYHLGVRDVSRSTLADANVLRPHQVFSALFARMAGLAGSGFRRATGDAVRLIDSTGLHLAGVASQWARFSSRVHGAKAHIIYDPDADTPLYLEITHARVNDITAAKAMPIEPGATYVFDLGYYDYGWWAKLDEAGCRLVSRLKRNTTLTVVEERRLPGGSSLLYDRVGFLPQRLTFSRNNPFKDPVREIGVVLDDGKTTLRLVTNDLDAPAQEIADLYKRRWAIELFFRWVKQTLRIKHFIGRSENAVRIQIAVALIAYLLIRLAKDAAKITESPLAFARLVRANIMHRRDLDQLLKLPPIPIVDPRQLCLNLGAA